MKRRPATDVALEHPWYVAEGVFAAATEQTQYLDVLDLLPATADTARAAVTYARDGGQSVSLAGASMVFDTNEDDQEYLPEAAPFAGLGAITQGARGAGSRACCGRPTASFARSRRCSADRPRPPRDRPQGTRAVARRAGRLPGWHRHDPARHLDLLRSPGN